MLCTYVYNILLPVILILNITINCQLTLISNEKQLEIMTFYLDSPEQDLLKLNRMTCILIRHFC